MDEADFWDYPKGKVNFITHQMNDQPWYDIGLESGRLEEEEHGWAPGSKRWAGENYGWQSLESYNKLYVQGKLNETQQQIDRLVSPITKPLVQAATDFYQNDPIIGPTLRMVGGGFSLAFQSAPKPVQEKITEVAQLPQTAAENIAAATGLPVSLTDPFLITDVATGGASALASKGLRQTVKTAVKGLVDDVRTPPTGLVPAVAGAAPTPTVTTNQVFERGGAVLKSTTSPEWTSPKAGLGSAESKLYAPAVKRWEERESLWQAALENLRQSGASAQRIRKFEAVRKGDLSTFDYDPENLYDFFDGLRESPYYKQTRQRGELKALEAARPVDPFDPLKKAQQHHVLAKAETKPFVETLMRLMGDNIANKDDLVNFFVWSEKYDLIPGNVQKNLLHMGEITHTVAKQDPMALHNLLKEAGLEYGSRTGPEIIQRYGLDKVKTADELMQAYDRYLQEIAVPSRDITYKVHDWWYDKTVKTLKGKELAEFKANYSKLSDPRKIK